MPGLTISAAAPAFKVCKWHFTVNAQASRGGHRNYARYAKQYEFSLWWQSITDHEKASWDIPEIKETFGKRIIQLQIP